MASRLAEVSEGEVVTIVEEEIPQKTKEATSPTQLKFLKVREHLG